MTTTRRGLLAFDGCDGMDLIVPYEVLLTANRLLVRRGEEPAFDVAVIGEQHVERYVDQPLAEATARQIDYVWTHARGTP